MLLNNRVNFFAKTRKTKVNKILRKNNEILVFLLEL